MPGDGNQGPVAPQDPLCSTEALSPGHWLSLNVLPMSCTHTLPQAQLPTSCLSAQILHPPVPMAGSLTITMDFATSFLPWLLPASELHHLWSPLGTEDNIPPGFSPAILTCSLISISSRMSSGCLQCAQMLPCLEESALMTPQLYHRNLSPLSTGPPSCSFQGLHPTHAGTGNASLVSSPHSLAAVRLLPPWGPPQHFPQCPFLLLQHTMLTSFCELHGYLRSGTLNAETEEGVPQSRQD